MNIPLASTARSRLLEVDALRGIAAVLVVLFHYTTRYDELYIHDSNPAFTLPWGYYGVNLFFMISGFVIFMTLARTERPLDFLVSRFSRLYPAYWGAVLLTFAIVHWLGLPGKEVGPANAALNVLMFQGLFFVPDVDAVYWTLTVELIFYAWALLSFVTGQLRRVHWALAAVLLLRIASPYLPQLAGITLPWRVTSLLILPYIPWFACGIAVYHLHASQGNRNLNFGIIALATLSLVPDGWVPVMLAPCLSVLLYLAARGRLTLLDRRLPVWLGAISYPLYLLHENVGWALIRRLEERGISANLAIIAAITVSLLLAEGLRRVIEQPAMRWLRKTYRERRTLDTSARRRAVTILTAITLLFCVMPLLAWAVRTPTVSSSQGLGLQDTSHATKVDCTALRAQKPLVLLVLGQSNAGNHGEATSAQHVFVMNDGACFESTDPLPGATGAGTSIWTRLPQALTAEKISRPLAVSVVAVESSTIRDWSEYGPLQTQLHEQLDALQKAGFQPDLVLWQQGEADAKLATGADVYYRRLARLVADLRAHDIGSPILLGRSTLCGNLANERVRAAIDRATRELPDVFAGADTDTLSGEDRSDGCHFSASGLGHAAQLWSLAIAQRLTVPPLSTKSSPTP